MGLKTLKPLLPTLGHKPRAPDAPGWLARQEGKTTTERGYGHAWRSKRKYVMTRDCGLCQPCAKAGRATVAQEVDHVVPKAEGGSDGAANLQAICRDCHRAKTAEESRRSRGLG